MVVNLTFIILFVLSLITMWLGVIFSFVWNRMLTRRRALLSLLVCIVLSLAMASVFNAIIADMGLVWEVPI
jgi:accessory gene regulator protein AgrB